MVHLNQKWVSVLFEDGSPPSQCSPSPAALLSAPSQTCSMDLSGRDDLQVLKFNIAGLSSTAGAPGPAAGDN